MADCRLLGQLAAGDGIRYENIKHVALKGCEAKLRSRWMAAQIGQFNVYHG